MSIKEIEFLLLLYIAFLSLVYIFTYVFFWSLLRIYRLLRKIPFFARTFDETFTVLSRFWKTNFPTLIRFYNRIGSIYAEYFADLLFFGVSLGILVDRYQSFSEYSKQNPGYTTWGLFLHDININEFYSWALIFFILWVLSKRWKVKQDIEDKKAIRKSLENIQNKLGCLDEPDIGTINKEIRKKLKEIRERK